MYVDDGSLISEIIVDHKVRSSLISHHLSVLEFHIIDGYIALQVVQKGIGHSPEDVTAALSSSDTSVVRDMKETLKQFQFFLVNFEVIINKLDFGANA